MSKYQLPYAYPHYPGSAQTETSIEAAKSIAPKVAGLADRVFAELKKKPQNCWEIEELMGLAHQTASARIRELALKSRIQPSGETRPTGTGHQAIVWCVCDG